MTLSFGNTKLELSVFRNGLQTLDLDDDEEVNMIETLVDQTIQSSCSTDPLEECLAHFNAYIDIDGSIGKVNAILDSAQLMNVGQWKKKIDPIFTSTSESKVKK